MHPHWLQHDVPARCPLCGAEGAKNAVLSTASVLPGRPPLTLLRCPSCGVAFLADLTPPDYEIAIDGMLDYYVEQGAGIDLIVAPLLRLPPGTVRRCLEIGGSVGFALDFGRWAFGWEVLGVDPSPLAAAGAEALGLPVRRTYFSAGLDLGPEPFDLAICSEVLEHLVEPHSLLAAIHDRLSPDGILVLSTPNLALVRPGVEEGALARALSPGFHMMLYDRGALARVLEEAGFAAVRVEESPETLRAFAARSPAALDRLLPADPRAAGERLRGYFAARTASAPPASSFASGFAYRHFKECVNAGLYIEAEASRARLAEVYRRHYGRDLLDPVRDAPGAERGRSLPFNLPGALYFSGILELNGLGRPQPAASAFAGAQRTGELLRETMPSGLRDGETEALLDQSRKHLPMALAMVAPDAAVREIEKLEAAPAERALPPALLDEARAQTFIRLVNAGAYAAAERLAAGVARRIESSAEAGEHAMHAMDAEALDSLYCLGMLALHQGRPGEAAELFGRVQRLAGEAGERAQIHWLARLHEGLSLWRAGRQAAARVALSEVAGAPVPPPPLLIAERFVAPVAELSSVVLPLDVIARRPAARLRFVVMTAGTDDDHRAATLANPGFSPHESLRLEFAPFAAPAGSVFFVGVLDLSADASAEADTPLARDLQAVRAAAANGRPAIGLDCKGGGAPTAPDLVTGVRGLAAFRLASGSGVRAVHGLDAFWCDAHGIFLRGWAHAHEHRMRALRVESAGRSARVDSFTDRPDLLAFYPAHEHVRHAGFAVYLACPPGHPVSLTLETDGGAVTSPLPLPEGPLPPWPAAEDEDYVLSPLLRRFLELANARGGRVLQVGARTPAGVDATLPRERLTVPVTGLDIHPGPSVDLVGDAHGLSGFLRAGSFDAVVSGAVLEHLEAPWLFAAEVNRVLKPGGVVYHLVPGAWPAHAQPNDFWRMSAEGLRVLFGAASGFEVLAARDSGPAVLIPTPAWRHRHFDMPTLPTFTMAEILARKVAEIPPGTVAWPLGAGEARARRYPVDGLHVALSPPGQQPGGAT
jgi:SAM-dependent methyltransferase